jgi:hypothetical protein
MVSRKARSGIYPGRALLLDGIWFLAYNKYMTTTVKKQVLTWVALISGVILLGAAAILFTPSSAPAAPSVSWSPASIRETILAGETKTVALSFTASENVKNVVVQVVPKLQPFVRTNPSSFTSITKGQTVNLSVVISAPATSLPGTFDGTIQLRSGSNPKITFAKPLPVTLNVIWTQFQDPNTGIAFSYPDFGQPSQVEQKRLSPDEGGGTLFEVKLPAQSGGTPATQFGITFHPNTLGLSLLDWFRRNIDLSGLLLTSGTFSQVNLPNGMQALIVTGAVPQQHLELNGPVALVYAMSNSGANIIVMNTSQENDLNFYGYPSEDHVLLLQNVLGGMVAP